MSSFCIRHNTGLKWVKQRILQLQLVVFQFLIVKVIKKSIYMITVRVINKKYLDNNGNSRIWKIVNDTKHVITHQCLVIPPMCSQLKTVGLFKNSWQFFKNYYLQSSCSSFSWIPNVYLNVPKKIILLTITKKNSNLLSGHLIKFCKLWITGNPSSVMRLSGSWLTKTLITLIYSLSDSLEEKMNEITINMPNYFFLNVFTLF